jgi:para-aminobenzoate synthetase / 4-amino-4-deoxychorismate lyase
VSRVARAPVRPSQPHDCLFVGPGTWLPGAAALLLRDPAETREATRPAELPGLLAHAEEASLGGSYVAMTVAYEAGQAYGLPTREPEPGRPLAWMAAYPADHAFALSPDEVPRSTLTAIPEAPLTLDVDDGAYCRAIGAVHGWIALGHTYQVNYTVRARLALVLDPLDYFLALVETHPVPYAAYLALPGREVLSLSPELLLRRDGTRLESRPMKGTRPRGTTTAEDRLLAADLRASEKDRAENLMIVDMVRNDLGRVARVGSVAVPELFAVERYRSVWQMTSTVTAEVLPGVGLPGIFEAVFPGASITGAPKLRTMEIIRDLESTPRGLYTGAIGLLRPGGDGVWSLPIRTLVRSGEAYSLGVGAGIVWDSRADLELAETRAKAQFALRSTVGMGLYETLLLTEDREYRYFEEHLARLADSADFWDYPLDTGAARALLRRFATECPVLPRVARLELRSRGELSLTDREPASAPARPVRVLLSPVRTEAADPLRAHKTTSRGAYDRERARALDRGFHEVLFRNTSGRLTEGAVTSVLVRLAGHWVTPPLADGLLPGVWRAVLLRRGDASERSLDLADLVAADELVVGNSVRDPVTVDEVWDDAGGHSQRVWQRPQGLS